MWSQKMALDPFRRTLKELVKKPKIRVRIIANKIDLLPKDASMPRVKGWIAREAQLAGLDKIKIMDVFPISCGLAGCCSPTI
jgi:ribosome biogenesis GTPase A